MTHERRNSRQLPSERKGLMSSCLPRSPQSPERRKSGGSFNRNVRSEPPPPPKVITGDDHIMEAMPGSEQGHSGWYRNGDLVAYYHLSKNSGQWLQVSNARKVQEWTGELTPTERRKLNKLIEQVPILSKTK